MPAPRDNSKLAQDGSACSLPVPLNSGPVSVAAMSGLALCCGASGVAIEAAAANWQAFGLQQLVFGDTGLVPTPERQLLTDVPTTARDEPCLGAMLVAAAQRSAAPWLLLLPADARLTPTALTNLSQLVRPGMPHQLVIGRAWRLPSDRFSDPAIGLDQAAVDAALAEAGRLDPPTLFSWGLLPRGTCLQAPADIGAGADQALPWLVHQAQRLGWPVLEASSAIPLLQPRSVARPLEQARPSCSGVVLPHEPGSPRLSLLLAAPAQELSRLVAELRPAPSLPWEVIARADDPGSGPGSTAAAWNSALREARGDLVWPLTARLPQRPLLPVVMRAFDSPWVDLLQLAWRLGGHHLPASDPYRLAPGCLVGHRAWLERLGGMNETLDAAHALQDLRQRAVDRGASMRPLPLEAFLV